MCGILFSLLSPSGAGVMKRDYIKRWVGKTNKQRQRKRETDSGESGCAKKQEEREEQGESGC
jgi:hypothetical protein